MKISFLSVPSFIVSWGCHKQEDWGHGACILFLSACGYTLSILGFLSIFFVILEIWGQCVILVYFLSVYFWPSWHFVSQCEHNITTLNLGNLIVLVILTYMSLMHRLGSHTSIWYRSYSYPNSYTSDDCMILLCP